MSCRASFGVGVVIVLGITLRFLGVAAYPPGYSYSKFSGPVSGPEHEIVVKGEHGKPAKDYVAKPDYQFSYGVDDPKSKVSQSRKESRLGDEVHGEYSVVEPNGSIRTVKYKADKVNGFQAQVFIDGKVVEHGNTAGSSDESSQGAASQEGGYKVTHDFYGSHSMEHGMVKDGSSNSLSAGRSSSEEGYETSEEGGDEEEGDDDDDEDDEDED